jgi:hypothetical protein
MTLPRKGSRLVEVEGVGYRWVVTGNDGVIDLYVERADAPARGLAAAFDYRGVYGAFDGRSRSHHHLRQGRAVTPAVVTSVIRWALVHGWDPSARDAPPFRVFSEQTAVIAPVTVVLGDDEDVLD